MKRFGCSGGQQGFNDRSGVSLYRGNVARQSSRVIGFCLIRQSSASPIVCFHQSKQVLGHTKSSDSDFAPGLFAAGLHIKILGARSLYRDSGASKTNDIKSTHMKLETLKDLYIHELKDLYSAEKL
jgi:hypothetical protein